MAKCRKRRYNRELTAMIVLSKIRAKPRKTRHETAYYKCPRCHGWHLTSKGSGRV